MIPIFFPLNLLMAARKPVLSPKAWTSHESAATSGLDPVRQLSSSAEQMIGAVSPRPAGADRTGKGTA
jgi:hypothetical protein